MPHPLHIDLRRDLPKVREQLEAILPNRGRCLYASPCVIGAMIPPRHRAALDRVTNSRGDNQLGVESLVSQGRISIPADQLEDARRLQIAFDSRGTGNFDGVLARLEAKYLTGEVA